jgi:hypothetical protein
MYKTPRCKPYEKLTFAFLLHRSGLAVMILMIPLNGVVAQKMKKYQVVIFYLGFKSFFGAGFF